MTARAPDMQLVLLPGMIGTADLFAPLLSVIPSSIQTNIIAYPPDRVLSIAELLKLIDARLSGQQQLVLLGESYSGAIALAYAAEHPERVAAVIISGAYVFPPWPSWIRWFISPKVVRMPLPSFLIRFFATGRNSSPGFVKQVRTAFRIPAANVMVQRATESLTMDFSQSLRRCRAPILYLAPDRDRMVHSSSLRRMLEVRPDIQVEPMKGPHLILQTAPVEAWQAILLFVPSLADPRQPS